MKNRICRETRGGLNKDEKMNSRLINAACEISEEIVCAVRDLFRNLTGYEMEMVRRLLMHSYAHFAPNFFILPELVGEFPQLAFVSR